MHRFGTEDDCIIPGCLWPGLHMEGAVFHTPGMAAQSYCPGGCLASVLHDCIQGTHS